MFKLQKYKGCMEVNRRFWGILKINIFWPKKWAKSWPCLKKRAQKDPKIKKYVPILCFKTNFSKPFSGFYDNF